METLFCEKLHLTNQPVGIWFTNEKPEGMFEPDPTKRSCVVDYLLMAQKGRSVVTSENTTPCAGGAVGLCFGDAFTKRNHPTPFLLSHGKHAPGGKNVKLPPHMIDGERFFDCPSTVKAWKADMPFAYAADYVVMRRFDSWTKAPEGNPDLVWMLVDANQLSALVATASYRSGNRQQMIAPFGAGCHSILYAHEQLQSENPQIILGMFDLSQRHRISRELLSVTMPYQVFHNIAQDCEENALTSHSWHQVEERYK